MDVFHKGKKISIEVKSVGFFRKGIGLMFRTRGTKNLLFEFDKDVSWEGNLTSLFVFFSFLTLWVDNKNRVIDVKIIKPFVPTIRQNKKFRKIIEIPLNKKNFSLAKRFVNTSELEKYYRR